MVQAESGEAFFVRGRLTCDTQDVVYVVTCTRCHKQGVGECSDPRARLTKYIRAIRDNRPPPGGHDCAILRHFDDGEHSLSDLSLMLVDALPGHDAVPPALRPTLRLRLEARWIARLNASLNVRRTLRTSFPGGLAAKRPAARVA
eukprot:15481787-Alexandrium_andersonii.AAC.1